MLAKAHRAGIVELIDRTQNSRPRIQRTRIQRTIKHPGPLKGCKRGWNSMLHIALRQQNFEPRMHFHLDPAGGIGLLWSPHFRIGRWVVCSIRQSGIDRSWPCRFEDHNDGMFS